MKRRSFLSASAAFGAACAWAPRPAAAARLTSARVVTGTTLYRNRPEWPVPNEPGQVFYLQRSINRNTIVFALRYSANGALDPASAVEPYWVRYEEGGARKPLRTLERTLAFGIDLRPGSAPDHYVVAMRALPQLTMLLIQRAPGRSDLYMTIGGETARPVYAFAEVIDGLIPRVTGLWIHGRRLQGGTISEFYSVAGGEVAPG